MEITAIEFPKTGSNTEDQNSVLPIVSFSELFNAITVIRSREEEDRLKLSAFATLGDEVVREKLMNWAIAGVPDNYTFHTIQFNILEKCSDGVSRSDVFQYMEFLNPSFSLVNAVQSLEQKLPGMKLSYSYTNNLTLYIHVSKKE